MARRSTWLESPGSSVCSDPFTYTYRHIYFPGKAELIELLLLEREGGSFRGSFFNFRSSQKPCHCCRFVKVRQIKVQAKTNRWLIWCFSFSGVWFEACADVQQLHSPDLSSSAREVYDPQHKHHHIYIQHKWPLYRVQHLFIEYKIQIIHGQNNQIHPKIYMFSAVQPSAESAEPLTLCRECVWTKEPPAPEHLTRKAVHFLSRWWRCTSEI